MNKKIFISIVVIIFIAGALFLLIQKNENREDNISPRNTQPLTGHIKPVEVFSPPYKFELIVWGKDKIPEGKKGKITINITYNQTGEKIYYKEITFTKKEDIPLKNITISNIRCIVPWRRPNGEKYEEIKIEANFSIENSQNFSPFKYTSIRPMNCQ
jgi:hypothetical protein